MLPRDQYCFHSDPLARLVFITHPEVEIDPATEITDWRLSEEGRRRTGAFAKTEVVRSASSVWSSGERKAREAASILAAPNQLPVFMDTRLGENNRSAMGHLPRHDFETAADAFFALPQVSFKGWESASDAQSRIASVFRDIVAMHTLGDLMVVSHGADGTLLWCHLMGVPIDRRQDQLSQGHYWSAISKL